MSTSSILIWVSIHSCAFYSLINIIPSVKFVNSGGKSSDVSLYGSYFFSSEITFIIVFTTFSTNRWCVLHPNVLSFSRFSRVYYYNGLVYMLLHINCGRSFDSLLSFNCKNILISSTASLICSSVGVKNKSLINFF